uniref:Uncharacterized protein n=1 Tax=Rhizophora mucronata TaxID=61149 RepID=A0A2P2QQH8_RHIMU
MSSFEHRSCLTTAVAQTQQSFPWNPKCFWLWHHKKN